MRRWFCRHQWKGGVNNGPLHYDRAVCVRCDVMGYRPYYYRESIPAVPWRTWWRRWDRCYPRLPRRRA